MKKFVGGAVFILVGYSLLDGLCAFIEQSIGYINTRIAAATVPFAKIVNDAAAEQELLNTPCDTQAIGFEVPQDEIWEEDEEDD